ncbi:MAG: protocatechuate 3,4-dioxygenase [Gammaproteobacteria bacterium]|jgi:protocatechuate 4,5-dioxygenase alpha chain
MFTASPIQTIQQPPQLIPGTYIFDGRMAMKAYNLNRMCYSFNSAENRKKFKAFPEAYCHSYHLPREQIHAVTDLDVLRMLQLGGNIYYLAKLTGIYGMTVQDLGAQQTGLSLDEFRAMLASQA